MRTQISARKNVLERATALMKFDFDSQSEMVDDPVGCIKALIHAMEAALAELRFELQKAGLTLLQEPETGQDLESQELIQNIEKIRESIFALEDRVQLVRQKKEALIRQQRQASNQDCDEACERPTSTKTVNEEQQKLLTDTQSKQEGKWKHSH